MTTIIGCVIAAVLMGLIVLGIIGALFGQDDMAAINQTNSERFEETE